MAHVCVSMCVNKGRGLTLMSRENVVQNSTNIYQTVKSFLNQTNSAEEDAQSQTWDL